MGFVVLAGLVVLAVVWLYWKWAEPPGESLAPVVDQPAVVAVAPPKVLTEPPLTPAEQPVVPLPSPPPVEKPAAGPATTAPAAESGSRYQDPAGRFSCWVPEGWEVVRPAEAVDVDVLLVSGKDVIKVAVHGRDWPPLTRDDQPRVEAAFFERLRLAYPDGLYGQLVSSQWRTVEGELALEMESSITLATGVVTVKAVEYRRAGRAHLVEMHIASHEQSVLLSALFEKFMGRYRGGGMDVLVIGK
jgi:hypothetical protein